MTTTSTSGTPTTAATPALVHRARVLLVGVLVAGLSVLGLAGPALADIAPVDPASPASPATVAADVLPTPQINGVVWSQVVVGNTVFVGGSFTTARPYGSAAGVNEVSRTYLLAYDITTGQLNTSFAPVLNGQVLGLAASPDGRTLYVTGDFTQVNGSWRVRAAAFDTTTGALNTGFRPTLATTGRAITATNSTVYIGGDFTSVASVTGGTLVPHKYLAAFAASDGTVRSSFTGDADASVMALAVAPGSGNLVAGGRFTTLGGAAAYGLGWVDPTTGAGSHLGVNDYVANYGKVAAITSLTADNDAGTVTGTTYMYGGTGNTEGPFRFDGTTGNLVWVADCHGDSYSSYQTGSVVYVSSHEHYCGNIGGFPQTDPWTFYHSTAFSEAATGTNTQDIYGYASHTGQPSPTLLNFFPTYTVGSYTGQGQATWSVSGNGKYVVYGGEFVAVNGTAQQGLVRYAVPSIAPQKSGPQLSGAKWAPSVVSTSAGTARVSFGTNWDRDNETLTYRVYRDSEANQIYQETITTPFWKTLRRNISDKNLVAGSTHRYEVTATDPSGNIVKSAWVSVTVSDATPSAYVDDVLGDSALDYWRLGESSGSTAYDWASGNDLTLGTGTSRGATGAIAGDADKATTFDGTGNGTSATPTAITGPDTFSVEAWFNTTSTSGGKIVGFGSSATGDSSSYDRHVYMTNSGKLVFGVYNNAVSTIGSSASYNDGQWHQVVASMSSAGMVLWVDGKKVASRSDVTWGQAFSGYWRVGGDNLSGWTNQPSSSYFAGTIDDVAVYGTALTRGQVTRHFTDSGRTVDVPARPSDAYGRLVYDAEPDAFWRYEETSGSTLADSGLNGDTAGVTGSYTLGSPGALNGGTDHAITFTGSGGNVYSTLSATNPTSYTLETWFRTTSTQGGKIIGFGSSQTGGSGGYDRHVYMQDNGQLVFGTWTGQTNTVTASSAYNDGTWHHVVATQGSTGMELYVDGVDVGHNDQTAAQDYTGYWRVGGDTTWGSSSSNLIGSFDDTAIYPRVLSAADVRSHYTAGTTGALPNQPPTASFTSTVAKRTATVDGSASTDSDGSVASYAWDFGDGSTGTGKTATHTYAADGSYTVTLTVTDDKGATNATTSTVTVVNQPPAASFTSSASYLKVSVDGSGSTDPDGSVASYAWDYGDGSTDTGKTASHTYAAAGTYVVRLTVTDDDGATASTTTSVTVVANQAPTASFTSSADALKLSVDGSGSSDGDGSVASYAWDYGDGSTDTGKTATHTYVKAGTYTVTLTVTDDGGATGTVTRSVTVAASNVLASDDFQRTTSAGWGSADTGGAWSMLTGSASTLSTSSGAGVMTLPTSVTSAAKLGAVSSTSSDSTVTVGFSPAAGGNNFSVLGRVVGSDYYGAQVSVGTTGAVQVYAVRSGTALAGGGNVASLAYTSGTKYTVRVQVTGTSPTTVKVKVWKAGTTEPAAWMYTGTDTTAALQVAGSVGLRGYTGGSAAGTIADSWTGYRVYTDAATAPVPNVAPTAAFTSTVADLKASVDGSGSVDSDGSVASYAWDFGDGSTGTGRTSSHTYAKAGTYPVKLTVTDDKGATGTVSHDVTVTAAPAANQAPTAAFTSTVADLKASVDGSGSVDSDGSVASYAWDFGDGSTGTGRTSSHIYATAGTYPVKLTVTDDQGASGTVSHDVTVTAAAVNAIAADAFKRSVTAGWGTADTGGAWTVASGKASFLSVANGTASMTLPQGETSITKLGSVSSTSTDTTVTVGFSPTAGGNNLSVIGRMVGSDFYGAQLSVATNGDLQVFAVRSGTALAGGGAIGALKYTAGDSYRVRVQVSGTSPTTVKVKVWKVGTDEPTAWRYSTTDSTAALQVAGSVGLRAYTGGSAAGTITTTWGSLSVVAPQ